MATLAGEIAARPRTRWARRPFILLAALAVAAAMVAGFGVEADRYFIHPQVRRPPIIVVHGLVFAGWMLLFIVQAALPRAGMARWHRRLGWLGAALALVMPPLGVATAITMRRFDLAHFPSHDVPRDLGFIATTFADLVAFTPCAWLALLWRRRPDYHARLMYLAMASIAEAGFGRLPVAGMADGFFLGNVALYAAAVLHDKVTLGRVHPVYRVAVPLLMLDEAIAWGLWQFHPAWWQAAVRAMIGLP